MPIIVIAGRIRCVAVRVEFESAEFTPNAALKKSQTLSVKETKIGILGRVRPYLREKAQRLHGDLKAAIVA